MTWEVPRFSRSQINKAGDQLVEIASAGAADFDIGAWVKAVEKLINWRASHSYPINTFQATLRSKLSKSGAGGLAAQRLKRAPSIIQKLKRPERTQLARMQDIAGLRGVVSGMQDLVRLVDDYLGSRFDHELVKKDDYIATPRESGYRGVHLVYRYRNASASSQPYQGLLVELQIRTKRQHVWATAVETTGTILNQALKASEGSKEWLAFFKVAASAFALMEGTPVLAEHSGMQKVSVV